MSRFLIVSELIYSDSERFLLNNGYELIKIPGNALIDKTVCTHPDMYVANVGNNLFIDIAIHGLFTKADADKEYQERIIWCSREATTCETLEYPHNIEFNCANVGNKLICKERYTNRAIIDYAKRNCIGIVNVHQGYAKCSTCIVSDNAVITEDESIAKGCIAAGIDVLLIKKGYVELEGYEYGFIGGCCGFIDEKTLVFNGNLTLHPDGSLIKSFCSKYDVDAISLCDKPLFDIGSIIMI